MMKKIPTKQEVKESVWSANINAAPGNDGLTTLVYKHCWEVLGDSLTEIAQQVHLGATPTLSQRTSLMVYGSKNNKPANSTDPNHKRRISLLNSDFKVITGIENNRFKKVATHTLSPVQLSAGNDRRIHHGINKARDAIQAAGGRNQGCGILDNDYKAAFDYMVLTWVLKVLKAKGLDQEVINRLLNLYGNNLTVVVVNSVQGSCFPNTRWSIRQGDRPSSILFCYGLDPHLDWLENRLKGIPIYTKNFFSPTTSSETYKLIAYVDDVKPSITSMQEFSLVDQGSAIFEAASGCILHRDPTSGKVKFLALGRWMGTLSREDLPVSYIVLSEHLDMVGVKLRASYKSTRKTNCDELQEKVRNVIGPWKGGKFMPLSQRSHSINTYCLSKVWFRCSTIDLRISDSTKISSTIKSWLFQDQLEKPEDFLLYRSRTTGGLGLVNVEIKALALNIRSFLETAIIDVFQKNIYHEALFQWHVQDVRTIPNPGLPPFYSNTFFSHIKQVIQEGLLNIKTMSSGIWYKVLLENLVTHRLDENGSRVLKECRAESKNPGEDWERIWQAAMTPGLPSELRTFLWRMLHNILPTRARLFRMNLPNAPTPTCILCDDGSPDTLLHALLLCHHIRPAADFLLSTIRSEIPDITPTRVLMLDFGTNELLPLLYLSASVLSGIWTCRKENKQCNILSIRATLEAGIQILRKSRFHSSATKLDTIISSVNTSL